MSIDVAYTEDGPADAPVVVLSNSLGATRAMWDPQVPALAERYQVITYDTRGHGESPAPAGPYSLDDLVDDLVALLDRVGAARAHVAGLSLGGMIGMRLAAREPSRCTGSPSSAARRRSIRSRSWTGRSPPAPAVPSPSRRSSPPAG